MSRLLVIDKCSFQRTQFSSLVGFARDYRVVLPYTLCIECLMSEDKDGRRPCKDPIRLLGRLEAVVRAGACIGCASAALFRKEKQSLAPALSIIDEHGTLQLRENTVRLDTEVVRSEAQTCRKTFEPLITLLLEFGQTYFDNVVKKGLCAEFRGAYETPDVGRFQKCLQVADAMKDPICVQLLPDVSSFVKPAWYTWQMVRLWWAYVIDWACKRNYSGPSLENRDISNDLYDMEYVAYLSRADGIITCDKKLVEPLARAAFPEKDVFSSLEEVPESYRCDWT
jgi:hypothetical protein